jgi:hypothetical protein
MTAVGVTGKGAIMDPSQVVLSPERRAFLALKGRLLYGKYCGTQGKGICAESFAVNHLQRGEAEVVVEFLAFLEGQLAGLRMADPGHRLAMTERLVARIRRHLARMTRPTSWAYLLRVLAVARV